MVDLHSTYEQSGALMDPYYRAAAPDATHKRAARRIQCGAPL